MPDFVVYPHSALTVRAVPRPVDAAMVAAGAQLLAAASEVKAYGLAAAHLGLHEPLVAISLSVGAAKRDYRVLYNPEITLTSDETSFGAEGSVSLPNIEVPVERAVWADVAFDDENGRRMTMRLDGFVARVALHEIDQMNGVFFLNRISRLKRDTALRKFAKSR